MQSDRDLEEWAAETAAELEQDDDNRTREKTVLGADGAPVGADDAGAADERRGSRRSSSPRRGVERTVGARRR